MRFGHAVGIAVVAWALTGASCGHDKPKEAGGAGGTVGSGGAAPTGGRGTGTGGDAVGTGGLGPGGAGGDTVTGGGGGGGGTFASGGNSGNTAGAGSGGRPGVGGSGGAPSSSWDAGPDDPACGFSTPPANCPTVDARCMLTPPTQLCIACIGGSRSWRPDPPLPGPVLCTCVLFGGGNDWYCPGVTPSPGVGPEPKGDCHVETDLSCADAKDLFVDDHCTEPAPCTP